MLQDLTHTGATQPRPRVAVLIDGDNLSHEQAGRILIQASKHGETIIRRVYGNAAQKSGWLSAPGLGFRHAGTGKNAADVLLAVEAMEVMLTGRADVLVVASSDRDFSHLATNLREGGYKVVGLGEPKTCEAFRKSVSNFIELPVLEAPQPATPVSRPKLTDFETKVVALVSAVDPPGMEIALLSMRMHGAHGLKISDQEKKTWRSWLLARPELFICDPKGPKARVRLAKKAQG